MIAIAAAFLVRNAMNQIIFILNSIHQR
jgi:hypothetical protein